MTSGRWQTIFSCTQILIQDTDVMKMLKKEQKILMTFFVRYVDANLTNDRIYFSLYGNINNATIFTISWWRPPIVAEIRFVCIYRKCECVGGDGDWKSFESHHNN